MTAPITAYGVLHLQLAPRTTYVKYKTHQLANQFHPLTFHTLTSSPFHQCMHALSLFTANTSSPSPQISPPESPWLARNEPSLASNPQPGTLTSWVIFQGTSHAHHIDKARPDAVDRLEPIPWLSAHTTRHPFPRPDPDPLHLLSGTLTRKRLHSPPLALQPQANIKQLVTPAVMPLALCFNTTRVVDSS